MFKLITSAYEAPGYTAREAQTTGRALAQVRRETVKVVRMTAEEIQAWEGNFLAPTVEDLEETSTPYQAPYWMEELTLADLAHREAEDLLGEEIARILAERQIHAFT